MKNTPKGKNPVQVLHHVLGNIHSDILTNFVRLTVGSVMREMCTKRRAEREVLDQEKSGFVLQTASSDIANRVVTNLMQKIESAILSGKPLRSEEVIGVPPDDMPEWNRLSLETIPSKEISVLILDTLNNIVSNMRLETSILKDDAKHVSSQLIQDFVLEKLQEIVESMQDRVNFDGNIPPTGSDEAIGEKESQPSVISGLDNKDARKLVSESLKSVVSELKIEAERSKVEMAHQTTSTLSLEAEAIVVEALFGIITECDEEPFKGNDQTKEDILTAMEGLMEDFKDWDKPECRQALQDLFLSSFPDEIAASEGGLDAFIESTLEEIVENIKKDEIKPEDIFKQTESSPIDSGYSLHDQLDNKKAEGKDGLSIEDMTHLTAQVLSIQSLAASSQGNSRMSSATNLVTKISMEVNEIAKELVKQTISNVKRNLLSEDDIIDLATAIHIGQQDVEDDVEADDDIEQFVVSILEKELEMLNTVGMDPANAAALASKLNRTGVQTTEKENSVSSAPSAEINVMVKDVLTKIADTLSASEIEIANQKASSPTKEALEPSRSVESNKSRGSIGSKKNINPNAMKKQLSAKSLQAVVGPSKRSTPVATVQSLTHISPGKNDLKSTLPRYMQPKTEIPRVPLKHDSKPVRPRGTYYRIKDAVNASTKGTTVAEVTKPLPTTSTHQPVPRNIRPILDNSPKKQTNVRPSLPKQCVSSSICRIPTKKGEQKSLSSPPFQNLTKKNRVVEEKRKSTRLSLSPSYAGKVVPPVASSSSSHHMTPEQVSSLCGSHKLKVKAVNRRSLDN